MITLVGSEGSMGKRYQAILNHLNVKHECFDKAHRIEAIMKSALQADRIIIATPTNTHAEYLRQFIPLGKPILCEKPIVKDIKQLKALLWLADHHKSPITMMLQYARLAGTDERQPSSYNYFRTGPDGLPWDLFQPIAFALETFEMGNTSPVWKCTINGRKLSLSDMDQAYVDFVDQWLKDEIQQDPAMLILMHEKVAAFDVR